MILEALEFGIKNSISNLFKGVFFKSSTQENENKKEEIIKETDTKNNETKTTSKPLNEIKKEESFLDIGIISQIQKFYVLVDNRYHCETKFIVPEDLKKGDKIEYLAHKINKGEGLVIDKILRKIGSVHDTTQEKQNKTIGNYEVPKIIGTGSSRRRPVFEKVFNDRVIKRNNRFVYVNDESIIIDLEIVKTNFVPYNGDWLKIVCLVEGDENSNDFQGNVLNVKSIQPLLMNKKTAFVSQYDEDELSGLAVIKDNEKKKSGLKVIFRKEACIGFYPNVGDRVVVTYVQSDVKENIKYRALEVFPQVDFNRKYQFLVPESKFNAKYDESEEINRHIEVTREIKTTLYLNEEKLTEVKIKNNGNFNQTIKKCILVPSKLYHETQVYLIAPNEKTILNTGEEVAYVFKCKGKFAGTSENLIKFQFPDFEVIRTLQVEVKLVGDLDSTLNKDDVNLLPIFSEKFGNGDYIKGIRPFETSRFIQNNYVRYDIPAVLWKTIVTLELEKKSNAESEAVVRQLLPILDKSLDMDNYKQRFTYLLFLEEIQLSLNMRKFNMSDAIFHKNGEYLALKIPGLAEKRPSLMKGDRIYVKLKYQTEAKNYEGFIHKVNNSSIYLKFNNTFHESYKDGEICEVNFVASTTVIKRCHTALDVIIHSLGPDFLFPTKVDQKEPQYNITEEEDEEEENRTDQNEQMDLDSLLNKRKVKWFNVELNKFQRQAVKNILKGLARPMPYVIFGPPGTGKTVTVVETILQLFTVITDSRILIATPSNSAANIIAEKLLDAKILKPGDMVRLVAYHYHDGNKTPERLIPYSKTLDTAEELKTNGKSEQQNLSFRKICQHRIIIGTCSTVASLYSMGCKRGQFTHVIIDEAGQITEPGIMVPLSLVDKETTQVVLAGDPLQLGPVVQSRLGGFFGLSTSFLDRLLKYFPYQKDPKGFETGYDPRLLTKLLINYRSLPDLLALPNQLFYDSELIPHVDQLNSKEAKLLHELADILPLRIGSPPSIVFKCVYGENVQNEDSPSWYNIEEATQVYTFLISLYNYNLKPSDIGIITPYSKQVHFIKSYLDNIDIEKPKIGSVEEFQGQERKIILLSTVRTCSKKLLDDEKHSLGFACEKKKKTSRPSLGFVSAKERLNVALTRARSLLVIFGNPDLLQHDVYWRSVIEHCKRSNSYIDNS